MFNVLIVDDETFVIKSLMNTVDWPSLNLSVVSTFSNGISALEYIETHPVDIVVTDVRMPGFSGLDLCHILSRDYPHIQLIIISGYADFSYAQKALKYNVIGYCVKPLDSDEFTLLLRKAISNLTPTITNYPIDIIDSIDGEEYETLSTYLTSHNFNPNHFFIMVSIGSDCLSPYIPGNKISFKFGLNKHLYILETFLDLTLDLVNFPGTLKGIGIYPHALNISQLKDALYDTIEISYEFFFSHSPSVSQTLPSNLASPNLSKLQGALANNNINSIKSILSEINTTIIENKTYNISFALKLCNLLTTHYIIHHQLEEDDLYIYNFDQLIKKYESFSDMLTALYEMLSEELSSIDMSTAYNNHFIHMVRYINNHYMKDITIGDVSTHLGLSSNYASQLFKKETGSTYTKYLTNLRMEKAKTLLMQTDFSINEICEQVGYNDYFYFLKIFKKHFGISPGKYKSQLTNTSL